MPNSIKDWIGPGLVGLLVFSIVLATAGFVASFDARRKLAAFTSDSRTAIGTVTEKSAREANQEYWTRTFHGAGDQLYQLSLCFRMEGRGYHCGTVGVTTTIYDGVQLGSPLRVTYVPSRPDWFYVGDEPPVDPESGVFARIFQFGAIASLLLLVAIAMMVLWPQDGMPTSGGAEADDVASRFRQRHGFGKRG